ncbi:MAG: hypothetical protein JO113_04995 [Candidatus Eremiobacteraeota bacterium]|nr:hypothetical protein [Candidatus Eremiobacteraeota bacterium]
MKFQRDPRDRRYPERLAGSFLLSLVVHLLLALLLFSVLTSSSQQGATESVAGGEVVTITRTSPVVVANQPAAARAALPVPHVPVIAPVRHAPFAQPQTQRLPVNRHELAKIAPTAPPNPRPIPQQSPLPNPQPTQNIFEAQPQTQMPAAPVNVPTVAPIAVAVRPPPTAAPSPATTAAPSAKPSPKPPAPVVRATIRAATPAPALPKASPTAAAIARASAAPRSTAAPAARASVPPAQRSGVPNPSPTTTAAAVARTAGTAPSPGPSGGPSPGPRPGNAAKVAAAPMRPIQIQPTPPAVRTTPAPKAKGAPPNINAKLRALLPNNPVNPSTKSYTPNLSLRGHLEPTPPPDVLAKTKYMYDVTGTGNEARVKMWVIAARKDGPTTICTGWLVRYPQAERGGYAVAAGPDSTIVHSNTYGGPANGTQITIGGGGPAKSALSPFDAGIAPIVDGMVSQPCDGRRLVPYAPSAASSP